MMDRAICSVGKGATAPGTMLLLLVQKSASFSSSPCRNGIALLNRRTQLRFKHTDSDTTKAVGGISSIFKGTRPPAPVDPRFEVIGTSTSGGSGGGGSSLVRVKMPPYSVFYTQVGQTLGQSRSARTRATSRGTLAVAALRPLLGRSAFVQEITTEAAAADVLVAPTNPGDVVVVATDGGTDYYVRRRCILAQTKFLSVSTWNGLGAGFSPLAFDRVGGRGTFVLNSVGGGIHRLVLDEGEDYYVDPRFVVAWSSTLSVAPQSGRPKPLAPRADDAVSADAGGVQNPAADRPADAYVPSSSLVSNNPAVRNNVVSPARSPAEPLQTMRYLTQSDKSDAKDQRSAAAKIASRVLQTTVWPLWRITKNAARGAAYASVNAVRVGGWAAAKTTKTLAGVPDLYRVTGPGDIYVATRISPRPWRRATHAVAAKSQAE
ncbi:hypothetical protein IWW48_000828 [Coemansia sp. RSA 1200]|nr:hypothetical protein IWW48_000828 [Coemansia sp. RSA 1200]